MRKSILSAAAIAVSFVAFAFAPVEKNNAMENALSYEIAELSSEAGTCSTRYKTQESFSECDVDHFEDELSQSQFDTQNEVLGKY